MSILRGGVRSAVLTMGSQYRKPSPYSRYMLPPSTVDNFAQHRIMAEIDRLVLRTHIEQADHACIFIDAKLAPGGVLADDGHVVSTKHLVNYLKSMREDTDAFLCIHDPTDMLSIFRKPPGGQGITFEICSADWETHILSTSNASLSM